MPREKNIMEYYSRGVWRLTTSFESLKSARSGGRLDDGGWEIQKKVLQVKWERRENEIRGWVVSVESKQRKVKVIEEEEE